MVKKISRSFMKGVGSVIEISPNKKYPINSYKPGKSSSERLRKDWYNVGKSISRAISITSNGR